MALVIINKENLQIVTLNEVKLYCHINIDIEDNIIERWIKTAENIIEDYLKITLSKTEYLFFLDDLPTGKFYLPRPPVLEIKKVTLYDNNNNEHEIESSNIIYNKNGEIIFTTTSTFSLREMDNVKINYIAGYESEEEISNNIKDAIMIYCAYKNENRAGENDIPAAFFNLLRKDRVVYV